MNRMMHQAGNAGVEMVMKDMTVENQSPEEFKAELKPQEPQAVTPQAPVSQALENPVAVEASVDAPAQSVPQKKPFHQRCRFTVVAVLLISLCYGLTTYANGFQAPTRLAVALGAFYPPAVQDG